MDFDQAEFDELLALKKDSAPGPDGIPNGAYRCAGGLGSKFLFHAYEAVLEGSAIPDCFAEKTVRYQDDKYDCLLSNAVDHFLEPFMRSACQ